VDAIADELSGRRLALVIATSSYRDATLTKLRSPGEDAKSLADVLEDERIGGFDVDSVLDASADTVRRRIARFCAQGNAHDLALIYLSCHGVLDSRGRLYYATADTDRELLSVTAVQAAWLNEHLDDCRCRRQILILDCCHSGAFAKGAKGDSALALQERFAGRGRIVLTASRGTEYSFEGSHVVGHGETSVFTGELVNGLRTGDADRDHDGLISVNELFDYAFDAVKARGASQHPSLWSYGAEGTLLVARSPRGAMVRPAPLPEHLSVALESPLRRVREAAVAELADVLVGPDAGRALTAREELLRIAAQDIPSVATVARGVLHANTEPSVPFEPDTAVVPAPEPEPTAAAPEPPAEESQPAAEEPEPPAAEPKPAAAATRTPPLARAHEYRAATIKSANEHGHDTRAIMSGAIAVLAAGFFSARLLSTPGYDPAEMAVSVVIALVVLICATGAVVDRRRIWGTATAIACAVLTGWTEWPLAVGEALKGNDPQGYWLDLGAGVAALAAAIGLSLSPRQRPEPVERYPTAVSRRWSSGAAAGALVLVTSSWLPVYHGRYDRWEILGSATETVIAIVGCALALVSLAAVLTHGGGLPWVGALLGCVAFGLALRANFDASWLALLAVGPASAGALGSWRTAEAPISHATTSNRSPGHKQSASDRTPRG
jgi:uncharacterized caspase-like protein